LEKRQRSLPKEIALNKIAEDPAIHLLISAGFKTEAVVLANWHVKSIPGGENREEIVLKAMRVLRKTKPAAASVMVVVEGGLVQNVISDRPAVVLVKDFDKDSIDEEHLAKDPHGDVCYYGEWEAEVNPKAVADNLACSKKE